MPSQSPLMLNQYVGLLPAVFWNRAKDPYIYGVDFLPATLSVTTTVQLQVNSDSDFACYYLTGTFFAVDNTTVLAAPVFTLQIADAGSGRFWSNQAIQVSNYIGTAQLPYLFIKPKIVGGGSTLTLSMTNLSATSYNVRLALHGLKIYPFPEQGFYNPLPMVNAG
jgi:hypothetical protein